MEYSKTLDVVIYFLYCEINRPSIRDGSVPTVWLPIDLGVTVRHYLKTTAHCHAITVRALRRAFTKLHINIFTTVYTNLVGSKLDGCVQASSPYLNGDSDVLEKMRRAFTCATSELRAILFTVRIENVV